MSDDKDRLKDHGFVNLVHNLNVAHDQAKHGLYVVKRFTNLLKVMCESWKIAAQTTLKACKQMTGKKDKLEYDKMEAHRHAIWLVNIYLEQTSAAQLKYCNDILSLVVLPLASFYKDGEAKRKKLIQQEEKITQNMIAARQLTKKEREECLKVWRELKASQEEMLRDSSEKATADAECGSGSVSGGNGSPGTVEVPSDSVPSALSGLTKRRESGGPTRLLSSAKQKTAEKKLQRSQTSLTKTKQRTYKAFQKFKSLINETNKKERIHRDEELPKILIMLERMEVERLTFFELYLKKFTDLRNRLEKKFAQYTHELELSINKLDTNVTLKGFITNCVKQLGPPPALSLMKYDLPCRPEVIDDSEQLKRILASDTTSTSFVPPPLLTSLSNSLLPSASSPTTSPLHPFSFGSPSSIEEKDDYLSDDEGPSSPPRGVALTENEARTIIVTRAAFDLNSGDFSDLVFQKGQLIRIVSKNEDDKDDKLSLNDPQRQSKWWFGYILSGHSNHFWRENVIALVPWNFVHVVQVGHDIDLRPFLEYPTCLKAFTQFLEAEYSSENIKFWLAVQEFHHFSLSLQDEPLPALPQKATSPTSQKSKGVRPFGDGKVSDGKVTSGAGKKTSKGPPPVPPRMKKGDEKADTLLKRAQKIAEQYIAEDAAEQVNIMGHTRDAIMEMIKPENGVGRATPEMFDTAQIEVFTMLTRDSWHRFKKTDAFKSIVQSYQSFFSDSENSSTQTVK